VQAVVEVFLQVGRRQHRDAAGGKDVLALVGHGRGTRRGVVAGDQQHAAVFRRTGMVGVAEDVAAAIHARPLAVPHRENAVVFGLRKQVQLLRAPHRGGGEILVDAVHEVDVVLHQQLLLLDQRGVEHADGRAAVAGDEHARLEPATGVGAHLIEGQTDDRVDAAEVDVSFFLGERVGDLLAG